MISRERREAVNEVVSSEVKGREYSRVREGCSDDAILHV